MDELFLLPAEKQLFSSLSADMQKGWRVEKESYSFHDSSERQFLRFRMLRIHDPVILDYKKRLLEAKNTTELQEVVKTLDLTQIANHEFSKLLFALGPDALGLMISDVMQRAITKDDIELLAALSGLRHLMLESLIESDF